MSEPAVFRQKNNSMIRRVEVIQIENFYTESAANEYIDLNLDRGFICKRTFREPVGLNSCYRVEVMRLV